MDTAPPQVNGNGAVGVSQLPPAALALAGRMFEAARKGDEDSAALLTQALERGLPANLTNDKGDSLVSTKYISLHNDKASLHHAGRSQATGRFLTST